MKQLTLLTLLIALTITGCSLIEQPDKKIADKYAVNYVTEGLTIKYQINGQTHTVKTDSTSPRYLVIDAQSTENPLLQVINSSDERVTINGSILVNTSDSPLGSVGGNLEPNQSLTVTIGKFSQ